MTVKTRNLANEPVAASGTAAFFEVVPAPLNADGEAKRVDTYKAVSQSPVATDAHGVGRVSFQAPAAGSYLIVTTLSDAAKRQTVASTNVWVSAEGGDSTSYRSEAMQIVFDKKRYKAGDTATVFIARPTAGVPILLTIEGDRLHETRVLRGGGPSVTVKLPVKAEYSPNAYISAIIVDGKQLVSATRSLNVMPADKFLTVTVTPDQKRYKPGDTARLTVSTVDAAGHGVPAEVSVGVVDGAIYALSPDHTPDPRSVFHGPRANTVDTAYSFAEDYSGGADKDAANPRVRKNFLDTAAWFPAIRTDGTGKAVVSVPLPDNLTTWIVTTRAHTADTKVGGDRMSFLTSQDLIVRLATPRFMVEGDRLTLIGLIHSYLPKQTTIRATLSAMGLALGGSGDARVTIDPNGVAKQTYALTAETAGTATLTLKASGDQAGDALEQAFPILPHGTADIAVMAGTSTGKTDLAILIPKDAVPGTATLAIELTPTPLGAVAGALTYLRDYPYGCIEQTLNRFVPELVAGPLVDARIDTKRLRDGMERISALQHQDGGWGWWVNDGSTPTLTAYTLLALKEAHAAGLTVPEPILRNGTQYLIRQWPNLGFDKITPTLVERGAGPDEQALVLHALSRWGLPRQDGIRQLNTNREGLSPQGLAHLAMAAWYAGDRLTAGSLIGSLDGLAINSEALSHWEPARTQPWFSDTTETTGLVVRAMTLVQPDSPRIDAGVRYLLTQRRGSHWQSTKDTAAIVLALAAVSQRAGEPPATMPVTVTMDGKTLAQTDLADPTAWRTGYRINVKADQLTVGNHSLTIQRDDSDTRALPYSLERSVFVRADHLDAAAREGLTITRKYRMLTAAVRDAKAGSNYARWFSVKEAAVLPAVSGKLAPGDLVLVELSIDTAKAHGYAMIEDPLPSGMEVIPDQNGDIAWSYWWSHREVRDDKVAFFIRQLPAGKHQVYYVLRPEIPGTVRALPPVISEMYAPDVRARDAETQLTVGE
ncbi:MAG: hypothetical protein H7338_09400 [Candidatus Sericytochromatia bacterium]|nr:hypothetical protein [Candidatus Sericytochromatia bacterium]